MCASEMATAVKMEMPVPAPAMMMGLPISEPQQTYSSPAVPVTTPGCTSSVPMPTPQSAGTTKNSQTPSPSASSAAHSASKRPARKSTLTQQQKNQKRQRATQDQLTTLEMEFNKNPTPNADTRVLIAEQINMTERSVQIWFQNRRAKIKLMAKKSLETGEDIDMIPESMRAYLAMQAAESGKGLGGAYYGRAGLMSYGPSLLLNGEQANQGKILIHHLTCRSLSIGKWMRVGQNTMDLIVFYSPDKCTMTYYINNENAGYKIEYPFSYIKNIFLDNNDDDPSKTGGIVIELNQPPNFFMDSSPSSHGFFMVGDFTENQQASQCLVHHLGGNPKVLSGQLAKLISLESFMTRHSPHNPHNMAAAAAAAAAAANTGSVAPMAAPMAAQMMQQPMGAPLGLDGPHNMSASAPVSPTARPSSQPNFIQPHVGLFQETQWGIGGVNQGMRPAPGHKRQRSRSVPMAVDFTMFQTPMPSFYIQQPGETQPQPHSANIYAPIPQPPNTMGPVNPNLRIDTQAGFGLDMRQYPMSATTAPSPSDYSSPNFFATQAPETATLPASSYNTPYSTTFLSPMMNAQNMVPPPSVSPLSFAGRSDPAIVDQSPPMTMMDRSGSADLYPLNGESAISDDGTGLNEMYSKHTINLPMHQHSPAPYGDPNQAELDMNQLVQFDAVDAASLSPESVLQNTV